jgi:hypothetical protein
MLNSEREFIEDGSNLSCSKRLPNCLFPSSSP